MLRFRTLMISLMTCSLVAAAQTAVTPPVTTLDLAGARELSRRAMAYAAAKQWKITVAIVNSEGQPMLLERGDGAYWGSIDAALAKARSAAAFQRPTSQFTAGIAQGRIGLLSVPGLIATEGGVPIVVDGKTVGAMGISGAKSIEDEECANAALGITAAVPVTAPSAAPAPPAIIPAPVQPK